MGEWKFGLDNYKAKGKIFTVTSDLYDSKSLAFRIFLNTGIHIFILHC